MYPRGLSLVDSKACQLTAIDRKLGFWQIVFYQFNNNKYHARHVRNSQSSALEFPHRAFSHNNTVALQSSCSTDRRLEGPSTLLMGWPTRRTPMHCTVCTMLQLWGQTTWHAWHHSFDWNLMERLLTQCLWSVGVGNPCMHTRAHQFSSAEKHCAYSLPLQLST